MEFKQTKNLPYDKVVDIFFSVGFLKHQSKRKEYRKAIETAFQNSQFVMSVWDDDVLVGFVRVVTDEALFSTIWNLIVHPKYQNRGLGKQLIQKCLEKYPDFYTFLIADEELVNFYNKLGFKVHQYGMYSEEGKKKCVIYN